MTFAEFIQSKGAKRFAETLSKRVPTTHASARMMASRNHISRLLWPDLLLVYPELGLGELMDMEAESLQKNERG